MADTRREVAPEVKIAKRRLWRYLLLSSYAIVLFASGALVALAGAAIIYVNSKPDLAIWHTADLDGEFTARSNFRLSANIWNWRTRSSPS